ncbi:ABC transporter ATP-binding protein [Fodinisporobacter ferrooxydans]|uniref:ABC transporter ATP-binding protein n=1 Tax=Fodinisporobacter ferrooxydans TaxID=2901836 RepID=A0ABY4CKG8_9BACL|nr:ABC transporter ATP-binding protein [Alicyclobacillaceae bacterium MYW30-H2]
MYIELKDVVKRFGNKQVLKKISLNIEDGQFVALLGPSGCGKTTLLNALAGLADIDEGSIQVGDAIWSAPGFMLPPEQRNVGMVFQDFALWPHLSVFDNVAFGLKLKKLSRDQMKARVLEVLELVQMANYRDQFPHQLSGGQKQRVAIARALAPRPTLMLMDEPLSSLDAKLREQMRWDLLGLIRKAGTTTIYVTHDQVEALSMADHVVLLNQGNIEQEGSPTQLYHSPATTFAAKFVGASNLLRGKVVQKSGQSIVLEYLGVSVQAVSNASVGDIATLMIRPSDITILPSLPADGKGTCLHGTIVQRAFHGITWQYRVDVEGKFEIEVWNSEERSMGAKVNMWLPVERCREVAETNTFAMAAS